MKKSRPEIPEPNGDELTALGSYGSIAAKIYVPPCTLSRQEMIFFLTAYKTISAAYAG